MSSPGRRWEALAAVHGGKKTPAGQVEQMPSVSTGRVRLRPLLIASKALVAHGHSGQWIWREQTREDNNGDDPFALLRAARELVKTYGADKVKGALEVWPDSDLTWGDELT